MRTVTTNIYEFSELSEKAQARVLSHYEGYLMDLDFWATDIKYDALETALINLWDMTFTSTAKESASRVISEHGESTLTFAIAQKFLFDLEALESSEADATEIQELEDDYLEAMRAEYNRMYENTCGEMCSSEALIDHMEANEWEFLEDGTRWTSQ
jgi:hypothetical protein